MTVILDLDGPLLDGRARHYACYREILEEHGMTPLLPAPYWDLKRGGAGSRAQLAASGAESIHQAFVKSWLDRIELPRLLALDRLQPGVLEKLESWRRRGLRLVLATHRRNRASLLEQLNHLGLTAFQRIVVCEGPKAEKVRDDCPELVSNRCVWIGDTEDDIEAGRVLGCTVWAVTCGLRTERFLAGLRPDHLVEDIRAVDLGSVGV